MRNVSGSLSLRRPEWSSSTMDVSVMPPKTLNSRRLHTCTCEYLPAGARRQETSDAADAAMAAAAARARDGHGAGTYQR